MRETLSHARACVLFAALLLPTVACGTRPPDDETANSSGDAGVEGGAQLEQTGLRETTAAGRPHPRGIVPVRALDEAPPVGSNSCSGHAPHLTYFGGQVIQSVQVVDVNWSSNVPSTISSNMPLFWQDVVTSSWFTWLNQYQTVGLKGADTKGGSNQGINAGTYLGAYTISPSLCGGTSGCTVTDAEIQSELANQIDNGNLPTPTVGCDGYANTIYMIDFPANVTIDGAGGTSCVSFCGYHFSFHYSLNGTSIVVPYGVLPDVTQGACSGGGCGSNTPLQNATAVASHELAEAVTDTDIADDTSNLYARPAAWGDNNCGEIGDICAYIDDTFTGTNGTWTIQKIWSNADNNCVTVGTGAPSTMCSQGTTSSCRRCNCSDTGTSCTGGTPYCETTSSNVDFGTCVQCTATSKNCSAGASCLQTSSTSTDDTCCTAKTTCTGGQNCSTQSDGCGGTINCGSCTLPQTCGGGGTSGVCGCSPATKCTGGQNCGTQADGCGGTVSCGTCTSPQTCGGGGTPNVCGCSPATKCTGTQNCGTQPDGCGGSVSCGTCTPPQSCGGGGTPNMCGCTPATKCSGTQNCGTQPDGCGGTISCGTCIGPQICGGGGVPGQCGSCTPATTCPAPKNCGTAPDGCGGTISCGTCPSPQVCGASGVCGCTPIMACTGGQQCGTQPDGCGGTITCGQCAAPSTCGGGGVAGQCGCTPATTCSGGQNCGSQADGCGGTIACGTCTAPQTCGGGGTQGVCGCTPKSTCTGGAQCGQQDDGCGGMVNCGTCGANQTCVNQQCVNNASDSGAVNDSGTPVEAGVPDAGTEAGAMMDAGTDSGTVRDAAADSSADSGSVQEAGTSDGGTAQNDAGGVHDSGTTMDSGVTSDAGTSTDSGSAEDSSPPESDAAFDASGEDAGGGQPGQSGGCGCKVAQARDDSTPPALLGFAGFALLGAVRWRRRGRPQAASKRSA